VLDDEKPKGVASHPLVDHPDSQISALAAEYSELESELVGSGPQRVRWPEDITFKNLVVYQLIPSLVYELEFPAHRGSSWSLRWVFAIDFVAHRIRPLYVFEKTVATFQVGTFVLSPRRSLYLIRAQSTRTLLDLSLSFSYLVR
jgi:sterol O-acyltransferase